MLIWLYYTCYSDYTIPVTLTILYMLLWLYYTFYSDYLHFQGKSFEMVIFAIYLSNKILKQIYKTDLDISVHQNWVQLNNDIH